MKIPLFVALVLGLVISGFSQQKVAPVEKTNREARRIVQFMTDWSSLSNRHDTAALARLLPADLILTLQDGQVQTKDEYVAALEKNPADFTITDSDQKVDLYGKTAIIRARYTVAVGAEAQVEFRYTVTFLKRGGRWQPIAFHSSPLAKP